MKSLDTPVDRKYAALVRNFPPRPIHNEREYDATVAVMFPITEKGKLTQAEIDNVDALSLFIREWEKSIIRSRSWGRWRVCGRSSRRPVCRRRIWAGSWATAVWAASFSPAGGSFPKHTSRRWRNIFI